MQRVATLVGSAVALVVVVVGATWVATSRDTATDWDGSVLGPDCSSARRGGACLDTAAPRGLWSLERRDSPGLPEGEPVWGTRADLPPDQPVLIHFWTSGCGHCLGDMPILEELHRSGRVMVIGIALGGTERGAREYLERRGVTFPNWLDANGAYAEALGALIPEVPTSLLVVDDAIVARGGPLESERDVVRVLLRVLLGLTARHTG